MYPTLNLAARGSSGIGTVLRYRQGLISL
jgi:hypothetical protein